MKNLFSFILGFTLFISPTNLLSNTYLMDPMPNHEQAPSFNLVGLDHKMHSLEEYNGKFLLVNFWATWCHPCKVEMPTLEMAFKSIDHKNFSVIGIHVGPDESNINEYLKLNPVSFPILIDMDLEMNWGVPGLPTTYLIGPKGEMLYRVVGKRDFSNPDMINFLKNIFENYKY